MKYRLVHGLLLLAALILPRQLLAIAVVIPIPGGDTITIDIPYAGPTGQLVEPDPPADAGFRPPTIFAAPLPVGSGARALGQAGAFTAVADDATAASWNPAGLVQLEQPEVSAVYRFSAREDDHDSKTGELEAGRDRYDSSELNYLSAVYPFFVNDRNAVVSLNYQEAYDFTQEFTASFRGGNQQNVTTVTNQTFTTTSMATYDADYLHVTNYYKSTTVAISEIDQVLNSALLSSIDFRQRGTIDAFSPAYAMDVSPKFSIGVALNIYTDGASRGNPIGSTLVANYSGTSDSIAQVVDTRNATLESSWDGTYYSGPPFNPQPEPFTGSDTNYITLVETNVATASYTVEGQYREDNKTEDFRGVNATLGALWTASDKLTLGAAVDLPWNGYGQQTKRINHQVSTFDSNLVEVADSTYQETQIRDVVYTFPLYWSLGALWRWSDRLYTSMDVSQTLWSRFSYKAEGEERINPVTGEPHSSSTLDDCWAVRLGGEYLCVLASTEIPLRAGVYWDQRPAAGAPDNYWGVSLGSGISLGKDPGKAVLDVAYIFERGENVMGSLLPEKAVYSDTTKHQLFVSAIWHF